MSALTKTQKHEYSSNYYEVKALSHRRKDLKKGNVSSPKTRKLYDSEQFMQLTVQENSIPATWQKIAVTSLSILLRNYRTSHMNSYSNLEYLGLRRIEDGFQAQMQP